LKNVEKDIGINIIKVKDIFDKSKENQDNYKFLYSELNIFKEKLEKMKIENQSRNELNCILRDSLGRINEIIPPQIYFDETNVKPNFDLPMQYHANEQLYKNRTFNQNINFNQNNDLYLVNNNKTDFPVKSTFLNNSNSKLNSVANNHDYNSNQNLLLIKNQSDANKKNLTKKNSFLDKNPLIKDNSINMNSPNQVKLFGNIKSNVIDIACLESNIFSDLSTENSKLLESRKIDFPRQNINYNHTTKAFNYNKGKTLSSDNPIFSYLHNINQNRNHNDFNQRNLHQEQIFFDSYNNKINNENLTSLDLNDVTKYESIQYDYSASIDLKKIDSRDFQNLEQINEERSEYSIPENMKNVNYYNYNVIPKENEYYVNYDSSRKNDNENIKSVFSKNRRMEVEKFNEKLANNFTYSNKSSVNNQHLYNKIYNNNNSGFSNNN